MSPGGHSEDPWSRAGREAADVETLLSQLEHSDSAPSDAELLLLLNAVERARRAREQVPLEHLAPEGVARERERVEKAFFRIDERVGKLLDPPVEPGAVERDETESVGAEGVPEFIIAAASVSSQTDFDRRVSDERSREWWVWTLIVPVMVAFITGFAIDDVHVFEGRVVEGDGYCYPGYGEELPEDYFEGDELPPDFLEVVSGEGECSEVGTVAVDRTMWRLLVPAAAVGSGVLVVLLIRARMGAAKQRVIDAEDGDRS